MPKKYLSSLIIFRSLNFKLLARYHLIRCRSKLMYSSISSVKAQSRFSIHCLVTYLNLSPLNTHDLVMMMMFIVTTINTIKITRASSESLAIRPTSLLHFFSIPSLMEWDQRRCYAIFSSRRRRHTQWMLTRTVLPWKALHSVQMLFFCCPLVVPILINT